MPATAIAERIGWDRSLTVLKDRVRRRRPEYLLTDLASRTAYAPREPAQCDLWFPPADVPLGAGQVDRPLVLVMVSGYCGGCPRWCCRPGRPRTYWPGTGGYWALWGRSRERWSGVTRPRSGPGGPGHPKLTEQFEAFRGTLGIQIIQCRPADPKAKGLVERANSYLETSSLPGRTFTGSADLNSQLEE